MKKILLLCILACICFVFIFNGSFIEYVEAHDTNGYDYNYLWINHSLMDDNDQCSHDECNYYDLWYYHSSDNIMTYAFNPQNYNIDVNNDGTPDYNANTIQIREQIFRDAANAWNNVKFSNYYLCNLAEIIDYNSAEIKVDFVGTSDYAGLCAPVIDYSLPIGERMHTIGYTISINMSSFNPNTYAHELGHALGLYDLDVSNDLAHHSATLMGYDRIFDQNAPKIYDMQGLSLVSNIIVPETARFYEEHPSYYGVYNKIYFSRNNLEQTNSLTGLVEKADPGSCTHENHCLGFHDDTQHYLACYNCYQMSTAAATAINLIIGGQHYTICYTCGFMPNCGCTKTTTYTSVNHTHSFSCGYTVTENHTIHYSIIPNNDLQHRMYCSSCGYSILQNHKFLPNEDGEMQCIYCNYIR